MKALNWLDRQSPFTGMAIVALTFLVAAAIAAAGRQQARVEMVQPTAPLPILVIATAMPTIVPTEAPVMIQAAPTIAPPTPEPQVIVQQVQVIVTATPEPPALQTFAVQSDEEPLSPALLREAMDQ
jgi:hypothetical protein